MTADWLQAVRRGSVSDLERLASLGADIDARDKYGQTGLMLAAHAGHARAVEWLAVHGAALDHTAKFGLSALMLAALHGHADVVRVLVGAGANLELRGSGAPGFAAKTAYDLAVARGDAAVIEALRTSPADAARARPAPFATPDSWEDARAMLSFDPRAPSDTHGRSLRALRVHVRDHRERELTRERRTLEAHYDGFVVSQARAGTAGARRLALDVSYGQGPRPVRVGAHDGRAYDMGPEPAPDDPDGRSPAVVTWCDGEMFYMAASSELPVEVLLRIAASLGTP